MSIIDGVAKFFEKGWSDLKQAAREVWHGITAVWSFLQEAAHWLDGAWDWMVNGVTWFTSNIADWAAEVFKLGWHIVTDLIPKAIAWAVSTAFHFAAREIVRAYDLLRGIVSSAVKWLAGLIGYVEKLARGLFHNVVKWVTNAVDWVAKFGATVWHLLSHPDNLVKWFLHALIGPLVNWILKSSAPIFVWLFKGAAHASGEVAHLLEDILAEVI